MVGVIIIKRRKEDDQKAHPAKAIHKKRRNKYERKKVLEREEGLPSNKKSESEREREREAQNFL